MNPDIHDLPTRIRPADGLAHVRGAVTPALLDCTVADLLCEAAASHPEREAAVFCDARVRMTYGVLAERVDAVAAGLLSIGIYTGDRVAIWSPNRPEWLLTQLATARIGAILVNINPAYRASELEYALNRVGVKALVCAVSHRSSRYLDMLSSLVPELATAKRNGLRAKRLPSLRSVIALTDEPVPGAYRFAELEQASVGGQRARLSAITAGLRPDDAINVQFTSGTTGDPKGATLSHLNIVNNARMCAHAMQFSHRDRLCIPVPLYHCFGMVLGTLACLSAGATMVFPGEGFDAAQTLSSLAGERCTAVHGVPTMFQAMLDDSAFSSFDLSNLRTGIMAGAPCPKVLMSRVIADMNLREMTIAYGMTETSPVSFQSATDDSLVHRISTVGRIQPHVEAKVISEQGATVAIGEQGELCTRGYLVMKGYWNDAARTREVVDGQGWMHTGDLATIDADGYCDIVGRTGDMIIRGGENVYPREVENCLLRYPGVAEAHVFGIADERLGEEICAWLLARSGETIDVQGLRAFCAAQLARFKVPRHISIKEEIPMTVTGKAQKFVMREMMEKELAVR